MVMARGVKTGGRKKGTPNRLTGSMKEMINLAITQELEQLPDLLNELAPKEKADFLVKLLPYVMPKADAPIGEEHVRKADVSRFIAGIYNLRPQK